MSRETHQSHAELAEFMNEQLRLRSWSKRELARQAGVSHSSVLRAFDPNPEKPAGYDVLAAIARVFRIHPMTVFVKAGLMPREPEQTSQSRHLNHVFDQLPAEHQQALIWYADYLFTQRTTLFPFQGKG